MPRSSAIFTAAPLMWCVSLQGSSNSNGGGFGASVGILRQGLTPDSRAAHMCWSQCREGRQGGTGSHM
jgi:hypothetical protein